MPYIHPKRAVHITVVCLLVCYLLGEPQTCASGGVRSIIDGIVAESQRSVCRTEDYTLNTDIKIILDRGQAIQLNCASNPYGLEKLIVYYYVHAGTQEVVRVDAYRDGGTRSGGGSRIEFDGSLWQVGYTTCLIITKQRVRDSQAHIEFCVSDDIERNHREYRERGLGDKKLSTSYRDWQLKPVVELPEDERIAGFARLWSEVKYNFAFFDQVPEIDWDQILADYLPRVQAAKTDVAYYKVLTECIALLRDGHTSVWGPTDSPGGHLPFRLQRVEGLATITSIPSARQINKETWKEALTTANLKLGEAILDINGIAVNEILARDICPYISASTPQALHREAYSKLGYGPTKSSVVCRIRSIDGKERQVSLYYGRYQFPDDPEKTVDDSFVYLNLTGFGSNRVVKEFDAKLDNITQSKGLILDVRQNGGGSTQHGYAIISRLINKTVPGSHWRSPKHIAAYKAWGRDTPWQEGDHGQIEPHKTIQYDGPVVVLTGPGTVSAAEDFVVAFQTSGRGKVIGQKTNGSTGQPLQIRLPGGGGARICTKRDTYPDGRDFVGVGCLPDIEVEPSRKDIAAGRDVVLKKAIAVLKQ
jgi:carboxyl-terminal processing protease